MTLENPRHLDHRPIKQHFFCKSRFSEVGHLASMVRYGRSVFRSSLIPAACTPAAISLLRKSRKNSKSDAAGARRESQHVARWVNKRHDPRGNRSFPRGSWCHEQKNVGSVRLTPASARAKRSSDGRRRGPRRRVSSRGRGRGPGRWRGASRRGGRSLPPP